MVPKIQKASTKEQDKQGPNWGKGGDLGSGPAKFIGSRDLDSRPAAGSQRPFG